MNKKDHTPPGNKIFSKPMVVKIIWYSTKEKKNDKWEWD